MTRSSGRPPGARARRAALIRQTERFAAVHDALEGNEFRATRPGTVAEGIAVETPGSITLPIIREHVDRVVTVTEPEIEDAPRIFGTSGTRVYSYRLVATREGSFRIPPVDMSWFDPESESYETAHTQPFDLTVGETGRDGGGRK